MFLILCAPPLLVFLYYMKSADVMLLCCYASDLVIKYRKLSVGKYIRRDIQGIKRRREIDK